MVAFASSRPRLLTSTGCKLQLSSFVLAFTVTSCLGFHHRFGPMAQNTKLNFHDFHSVFAQPANNVESMINLKDQYKPSRISIGVNPNDITGKVENVFSEFGEEKKFKRMGLDKFNLDELPQPNYQKSLQFVLPEKETVNIAEQPNQEENTIINQRVSEPQGKTIKESETVIQGKAEVPNNNQEISNNNQDVSLLEKVGRTRFSGPKSAISSLNVLFHTLDTLRPETNSIAESNVKVAANVPKQEILQVFDNIPKNLFVSELQMLKSKNYRSDNLIDESEDTYNKQDTIKKSLTTNVRRKILFPRSKKRTSVTYQGKIVPIKHSSPSFPKWYHTHNIPLSKYGLEDPATLAKTIFTGSHVSKMFNGKEENMTVGEKQESSKYFEEFTKIGQNNGQNLQNDITNVLKSMVMGAQNEAEGNSGNKNFAEINNLEEIQNAE